MNHGAVALLDGCKGIERCGGGTMGISNHFGRGIGQMGVGVGVKWTNWVPRTTPDKRNSNSNKIKKKATSYKIETKQNFALWPH